MHSGKSFDPDDPEHMQWVYSEVNYMELLSDVSIDIDFHY